MVRVGFVVFTVLVVCVVVAHGQQNLVVNSTFDEPVPSNGAGGGWITSHIDNSGGWRDTAGDPGAHFVLNDAGAVASDPTLAQSIAELTVGKMYRLSGSYTTWWLSGNSEDLDALDTFEIAVDGAVILQSGITPYRNWQPFHVEFEATQPTVTIELRAEANGTDNGFAVDSLELAILTPGDLDDDGVVGGADLAILLASWGPCPGVPEPCPADIAGTGDGVVGGSDLAALLAAWGPVTP